MHVTSSTAEHKNGCPGLGMTHGPPMPARVFFGAAGAVCGPGKLALQPGRRAARFWHKLASYPPTRLFGIFFVEVRGEAPVAVTVRWQRDR